MPLVKRLQTAYGKQGVQIYGINCWDERPAATATIQKMGLNYTQLFGGVTVARTYGVRAIPSLWVVGKDGKIAVADGSAEEAAAYLKKALGK